MGAIKHRHFNWILIFLIGITSTDCLDFCFGSPDPDPVHELIVLDITPGADSLSTQWNEVFRDREYIDGLDLANAVENHTVSIGPDGRSMLWDGSLITFRPHTGTTLENALTQYQFTNTGDKGRFLVSRASPDSIHHDADNFIPVPSAVTSMELRTSINQKGMILASDTAHFISQNRYQINRFFYPVLSRDDRKLLYLKSVETREIVQDSTGQVVDDFLYANKLELHYASLTIPLQDDQIITTFKNVSPQEHKPHFDLSPDHQYVTYEFSGEVYLTDTSNQTTKALPAGYRPKFSPTGRYILISRQKSLSFWDDKATAIIFDLQDQTQLPIESQRGVNFPVWHPAKSRVLYFNNRGMNQFDMETESHTPLFKLNSYKRYRELDGNQNINVYPDIFLPTFTSDQLYLVGSQEISFISDDDC